MGEEKNQENETSKTQQNNKENKSKIKKFLKIVLIIGIVFVLITPFILYLSKNKIKNIVTEKLIEKLSKKTDRKISYSKILHSFNGFEIDNPEIYEKKSNKIFAKAKKLIIKMDLMDTILNKKEIEVDEIRIEDGEINLIKNKNEWNFSDILDLIPKDSRPLSERYSAKMLRFENFNFLIKENLNEIFFKNSKISIFHNLKSEIFYIKLNAETYLSLIYGKFFFNTDLKTKIHLKEKLKKINIDEFKIKDFSYGNFKFEEGNLNMIFDFQSKNLDLNFLIKNFSGIKNMEVTLKAKNKYKKITSREINIKEPFDADIKIKLNKEYFKAELISDNISLKSEIDINANKHLLNIKTQKLDIKLNSELKNPILKGEISEGIESTIRNLIISYEKIISDIIRDL
jgi:hypothetical protein